MGESCGLGAGLTPGFLPPSARNEFCVLSEGTQAILGQSLRYEEPGLKTGALSLPPATKVIFEQPEELLPILGGQKEHRMDGHSPDPKVNSFFPWASDTHPCGVLSIMWNQVLSPPSIYSRISVLGNYILFDSGPHICQGLIP